VEREIRGLPVTSFVGVFNLRAALKLLFLWLADLLT